MSPSVITVYIAYQGVPFLSAAEDGKGGAVAGRHPARVTELGLHLLPKRRGDLFPKRCELAEAWAAYCAGGAEVIDLAEVWSA